MDADRVPRIFVRHPISDQTQNQMHDKADDCFDRIFDAISNDWSCDIVVEERKKNEDDDCTT